MDVNLRAICVVMLVCTASVASAAATRLPKVGADAQQTSVSGLSSGAFMAVQLQVAFSERIVGAGIVAAGPYYCLYPQVNKSLLPVNPSGCWDWWGYTGAATPRNPESR